MQCSLLSKKNYGRQNTRTVGKVPGGGYVKPTLLFRVLGVGLASSGPTLLVLDFTPDVTGQVAGQARNLEYRPSNETSWSSLRLFIGTRSALRTKQHCAAYRAARRPFQRSAHTTDTLIHCPTSNGGTQQMYKDHEQGSCINSSGSHLCGHGNTLGSCQWDKSILLAAGSAE